MSYWNTNREKIFREPPPNDPYLKSAYDFAQDWLVGKQEFTLSTSGSTGAPKPITLSRAQLIASAKMTGNALALPESTRALACLNTNYIAGMMMLVRGVVLGWEMTITEPSSNPLLGLAPALEFNFVAMVPMQLSSILQDEKTRERIGACGKILLGGAAVSKGLLQEIRQLKVPVFQSYGMTETVSHVALRRLNGDTPEENYRILPGIAFGTDGRECLFVHGEVTDFKVVQTNDLVEITSPNTFRWLGRADSVINSGGVKISLDKIDEVVGQVLQEMQATNGYFCWHKADEKLGQKLVLFVETVDSDFDQKELLAKISTRVKPYETPKAVYFVSTFARTRTAKINKITTAQSYFKNSHD